MLYTVNVPSVVVLPFTVWPFNAVAVKAPGEVAFAVIVGFPLNHMSKSNLSLSVPAVGVYAGTFKVIVAVLPAPIVPAICNASPPSLPAEATTT